MNLIEMNSGDATMSEMNISKANINERRRGIVFDIRKLETFGFPGDINTFLMVW